MPLEDVKERNKALDNAVGQIEKQFGKGSIMRLGQRGAIAPVEVISTGSISIDYALGIGGLPRGRVIEIYGPESSGKTTLALQVIAEAQRAGGMAAFQRLSMRSTPSTRRTRRSSASISTISWCRSQTTASRRSKSSRC